MKIVSRDSGAKLAKTDLLCVFAFKDAKPMLPTGVKLGRSATSGFDGEFRSTRTTDDVTGPASRVLLLGLGEAKEVDSEKLRRAAAVAVQQAEAEKTASIVIHAGDALCKQRPGAGLALAEGARMGAYSFTVGKSEPKPVKLKSVVLAGAGSDFKACVKRGLALAEANCFARDLGNLPGNMMRPRDMAAKARALAKRSTRITARVHDEKALKTMGAGALLSVSAGSVEPAYMIHLTYKPKGRSRGKLAFIGKGLTFDAGGISLKPSAKMDEMKYDMCGGAAVLGLFHALADLDVPFEVHGVVPTSENLPDAKATKPGDLVTAMDGTTIEVLNTDAEGRLILCDAICYTQKKIKPDTMIDLATLTGAVVVALGHEYTGMMATTDTLRDELSAAGAECGEAVWPLPLEEFHREQMKGVVADLKNINGGEGAGSTSAAAFLSHFVKDDVEWAHLDIAGAAWGGRKRDWVGGPTGSGVGPRLLMQYLQNKS